jgi:hypothetical protein
MANRYLADAAAARVLQPQPLTDATDTKVGSAIEDAEDLVDAYLGSKGVTVPITGDDITDLLKKATATMVAAVLYKGHNMLVIGEETEEEAHQLLDKFIATTDLDITSPVVYPEVSNYQENFISDHNEPNETIEAMDE